MSRPFPSLLISAEEKRRQDRVTIQDIIKAWEIGIEPYTLKAAQDRDLTNINTRGNITT